MLNVTVFCTEHDHRRFTGCGSAGKPRTRPVSDQERRAVFPRKCITVNLAPASVCKEGPAYDLPIALGVLAMDRLTYGFT
jgi:hypothetical protein